MTEPSRHPCLLTRIELRDFKSVAQASVDLKPLTVVVGANSSGKSTLIQAILSIAQAVRSRTASPKFPLNGEFIRLGSFRETRNFLAAQPDGTMEIAFRVTSRRATPGREFSWRVCLRESADGVASDGGYARIESVQVEIERGLQSGERATVLTRKITDLQSDGGLVDLIDYMLWNGRSRSSVAAESNEIALVEPAVVDSMELSRGLWQNCGRAVNKFDYAARLWWDTAENAFEHAMNNLVKGVSLPREAVRKRIINLKENIPESLRAGSDYFGLLEEIYRELLATPNLKQYLKQAASLAAVDRAQRDISEVSFSIHAFELDAFDNPRGSWIVHGEWYDHFARMTVKNKLEIIVDMMRLGWPAFREELRMRFEEAEWLDERVLILHPDDMELGTTSKMLFLAVRYLGPLREAPRALHDTESSNANIGVSGEYTAAVLYAGAAGTIVGMPTQQGTTERCQLIDALDYWLKELGMADRVRSEGRGRFGISLRVRPQGLDRDVDLTAVGVGLSQLLPVIVVCLLAEPGTLIILEQPELHLHPRLEQKLADFLLACVRSGRQLVVETHSEHLVNRLRCRIAGDDTTDTHDLIKIIFAESNDGITSYREPEINPYGGTSDDWPEGFLDLGAREAQDLVLASLAKRKRDESAASAASPA